MQPANPVSQRFRVGVSVEDTTGKKGLTIFKKETEQLVGVPVAKNLHELGQVITISTRVSQYTLQYYTIIASLYMGWRDMSKIPAAVNNIIRKVCVFQIKVTPYNTSHGCEEYTVTRVIEEVATEASKVGAHTDVEASKLGAH